MNQIKRRLGQIALAVLMIGAVVAAAYFLTAEQSQTALIVILFLGLTWVYNDLREKIGIGAIVTEKEKFALSFDGKPIIPKHERPEGFSEKDIDASAEDVQLFYDFAGFADRLNKAWEENSPWRVQESKKSHFLLHDEIAYGRQYEIFCNQRKMGYLRLAAGYKYSNGNPNVLVNVWLANARILSADELSGFFSVVNRWICSTREQILQNEQSVRNAMVRAMWELGPLSNDALEVTLTGTAATDDEWLRRMKDWRNTLGV